MTNRLIMAAVTVVLYVIGAYLEGFYQFVNFFELVIWGALSGLIFYEIMYQTRQRLNLKTIALYFLGFLIITDWLSTPIYYIFNPQYYFSILEIIPSLERTISLFSPGSIISVFNLAIALATGVGYYLVKKDAPLSVSSSAAGGDIISYGGAEMDFSRSQTTRYLLATVLLSSSFRNKITQLVEQERNAFALELGIDLPKLARISYLMNAREKKYSVYYFIITVITVLILPLFPLSILAVAAINFYKRFEEKYKFVPYVKKKDYDPDHLENMLRQKYSPNKLTRNLPTDNQNLVVYKGFFPFVGAGIPIGGWSLSINANRPREEMGQLQKVKPFKLEELYRAVEESIDRLKFDGFTAKDYLFVNGKEIRDERWLLPSIYWPPIHRIDQKVVDEYVNRNDILLRHYKWMQIYDWSNEIVISHFLRFSRQGDYLFVETNRCILTPLEDKYREIDRISSPHKRNLIGLGLVSLIVGPISAIFGSFSVIGRILTAIGELDLFGNQQRAKENEMKKDKKFDYGTDTSLRTQVSSYPNHYFQVLDQEMYLKVLEKQIIEGLNGFLKDHNIDTSDIHEQQNTILNAGVIMEGGKVDAKSVAVGARAEASVNKQPG